VLGAHYYTISGQGIVPQFQAYKAPELALPAPWQFLVCLTVYRSLRVCVFVCLQVMKVTDTDESAKKGYVAHAPATQGLQALMEKLGGLNERHEDLVKRVDELEV